MVRGARLPRLQHVSARRQEGPHSKGVGSDGAGEDRGNDGGARAGARGGGGALRALRWQADRVHRDRYAFVPRLRERAVGVPQPFAVGRRGAGELHGGGVPDDVGAAVLAWAVVVEVGRDAEESSAFPRGSAQGPRLHHRRQARIRSPEALGREGAVKWN